jgi:peptide/nickel transport system substrate-binding protein
MPKPHRAHGPRLLLLIALIVAACSNQPAPSPPPAPATRTPSPNATAIPPTAVLIAPPTSTPSPLELVVCQTGEPSSLYLYGEDLTARAGILEALFDGPIDSTGFSHQPVILTDLPSVEAGTAGLELTEAHPGDKVVDAATGAVVPLAEGVQLAQLDGSVITYTGDAPAATVQTWAVFSLRPGLLWSDGQPLTADDSQFSFEIARSPDTPSSKYVVERTSAYQADDDTHTRWTGLPGWVDTSFNLRFWTPMPRHLYGLHTAAELLTLPEAVDHPVGWGPFRFDTGPGDSGWFRGDHLTLVRNPNYFRASEGLPKVDQITFRFGLDPVILMGRLIDGGCDIAGDDVDWSEQLAFLVEAKQNGRLAPQFVADNAFEHLDFGIQPAAGYKRPAGNDLFKDASIRQAFAYCLDRQALIDQLVNGLSEVPASYIPSTHPDFAGSSLALYPFDPAKGKALLEAAGWVDADGDGVRELGKRRLSLSLFSGPPESPFRTALLQFIQAQLLNNCAIEAQPALHASPELYDPWPTGLIFGRQFDLTSFPWRAGSEPPCELYTTDAIPNDQNPGGANDTGYSSADFDAACAAARHALDAPTRHDSHVAAQVVFTQDLPSLPLFFRPKVGVASLRVNGLALDSTANSVLWNVESLSLAAP